MRTHRRSGDTVPDLLPDIKEAAALNLLTDKQILGLDSHHLQEIRDPVFGLIQCQPETATPLQALLTAALDDGIPIRVVSSHRDFNRQLAIWNRKFSGNEWLCRPDSEPVRASELSPAARCDTILRYSALPGASRHHWGTDFDIFDAGAIACGHRVELVPEEFAAHGPCGQLQAWLEEHLNGFGFYRPYREDLGGVAPEPWHISFAPSASGILEQFPETLWQEQLKVSAIEGYECLAPRLDELLDRYLFRVTPPPRN